MFVRCFIIQCNRSVSITYIFGSSDPHNLSVIIKIFRKILKIPLLSLWFTLFLSRFQYHISQFCNVIDNWLNKLAVEKAVSASTSWLCWPWPCPLQPPKIFSPFWNIFTRISPPLECCCAARPLPLLVLIYQYLELLSSYHPH